MRLPNIGRQFLPLLLLFCAWTTQAQSLAWKTTFPLPPGFTKEEPPTFTPPAGGGSVTNVPFLKIFQYPYITDSAGDGFGGSVYAGQLLSMKLLSVTTNSPDTFPQVEAQYARTNTWRVLWLGRNGRHLYTNDVRFRSTQTVQNGYLYNSDYLNFNFVRCTTNEVAFQITGHIGQTETNLLRRITRVGTTFYVKDKPLRLGEQIYGDTRPTTDSTGYTSLRNRIEITRYTRK